MTPTQAPEASLWHEIGHVAGVLGNASFPPGDRAALRRMASDQRPPLGFYRFAASHLPGGWDRDADAIRDWVTIVAGIAVMSPDAHQPSRGLGAALAEAGYAESRLERLLGSEDDVRRTLLLRAARFLAAKSLRGNWVDGAQLLLARDPEAREAIHRRVARDFYGALQRSGR